jgi:L-alanine-DL-glutamate epimerase-like enolase superfamily enzyme
MQITDIRIVLHERQSDIMARLGMGPPVLPMGVLRVLTDEGVEGNDFLSPPSPLPATVAEQIVRHLKPRLVGRNPLDIGALWMEMNKVARRVDPSAIGVVDVALWDIAGKVAGLPIHRLLGTYRDKVPAYFSSGHHARPEDYAEEAVYWRDRGWKGYKLHPPSWDPRHTGSKVASDVAACAAVREAVGDGQTLMLDSVWSYSYPDAVNVGRAIQELGYYWYEDPLAADDLHGYVRLKQQLHIPILATEITLGGLYALPQWLMEHATDFLRGDVVLKGGITGLVRIAHLAEAFRMNCEVHDAYNALNNAASLHVIMAMPNCEWFEVLTFDQAGEHSLEHLSYGLARPIEIDAEGFVHAPAEPGIGFGIDWELIESAKTGEIS